MGIATVSQTEGEQLAQSSPMGWLARLGLAARGVVYFIVGWLGVMVASGGHAEIDQKGALSELLTRPLGFGLVALLAAGFAAYALWRLSEGVFGSAPDRGAVSRVKSLFRGLVYGFLAFTAVSVLAGTRTTQSGVQTGLASSLMGLPGGRILVALTGSVVVAVGVLLIFEGWSASFMQYFGYLPQPRRAVVVWLGRVGTVARGAVFTVAGLLVVAAAWTASPEKAGGVDEAFKTLLSQPCGSVLVALLGVGLVTFGVYGLAEALWRHVPDGPLP